MSWDSARLLAHVVGRPRAAVSRALEDAVGCVLAGPLVSPGAVPPVDRSAMDGYAVCGGGPWRVVGHVGVECAAPLDLSAGQACSITTGAAVPAGTTSVLRDEDVALDGEWVCGPSEVGRHIRRAGEECQAGEVVLPAGVVVDGPVLGLAASLGLNRLIVIPQPVVAVLITGDELVHQGPSAPGRVRDALGPMLPNLITRAGAGVGPIHHLPDTHAALLAAIKSSDADVVLVSGSSASGPADHLRAVLREMGAELVVDGVACRPGHPQALARLADGRLVIGLPGNPLAALTAFLTLGVAAIAGLRGLTLPDLPVGAIPGGVACHPHSTRLVPVRVTAQGVVPVGHGGSAMLRGAAGADALAVVEPGPAEAVAARLLPLDPGTRPWAS
ncbi:molybdopterin molybdenumtransferase MoeA [Kribbella antibiotica]|uniref:Molybdopterin molybdenumtransferase n=1 Tax=Kribbella antibiotica TaxID=190195 RepID=A0A4V2YQF2_9ACTN|nr:molybdopterin molybdotransferase MoeA [Kribbella antibiotica]TDD61757.1 molybdopterin molybdenumtransferase MoeA [Kribbella antibiotica]